MNIAGHIAVASAVFDIAQSPTYQPKIDALPAYFLGAALPDISNIAGVKLRFESPSETIAKGVQFHHQTDTAFHRHPWFVDVMGKATTALLAADVSRGAARACGHVGPELLLDDALLQQAPLYEAVSSAFRCIENNMSALEPMVQSKSTAAWAATLRSLQTRKPPSAASPREVAVRLQRILAPRRRLALADHELTVVADVIATIQPHVAQDASWLVTELATELVSYCV